MIGKLYEVERKADEAGMTADERRELRQKEAYPVIQLMERWCVDTYSSVLESSLLGKAIAYTYSPHAGQPMDDLLPLEYAQRPESRPCNLPDPD